MRQKKYPYQDLAMRNRKDEIWEGIPSLEAYHSMCRNDLAPIFFLIFTIPAHPHQLKDIEVIIKDKVATYFIGCKLNGNIPEFTFKLKNGWSDLKLGCMCDKVRLNGCLKNKISKSVPFALAFHVWKTFPKYSAKMSNPNLL